ncbi:RagB/SusD family nutrient uptake outer membrane protein [Galbibacter orientalis]|uniref:RagB/SusD family nutrient uptake outer membrane protein n=1 Tax=Galbibacter orientalis TaxID=453852 RepID=UPI003081099D
MKYIYKYKVLFLGLITFGVISCEDDFLDTKLDTFKTPEAAATDRGTLWTFANAFYAPMTYGYSVIDGNLFAAASDEAQQTLSAANCTYFNNGTINENVNPIGNLYENYYEGIRAANFFLEYAENGEELIALNRDTITDVVNYQKDLQFLKWYRAEAHIARAYYYTELLKMYGGIPIIESTFEQGEAANIPRSSYEEVVQYIVNEIDTYKDSLQVNWKTSDFSDQDGRFTLGAALGIKSRALLYAASPLNNTQGDTEKWKLAAAAANELITSPLLNYTLDNGGYYNYFTGNTSLNSAETIFAIRRNANNQIEALNYPITTPGGNSGITPSHNLVAAYEYISSPDPANPYANRDPRLQASVVTNGSSWNGREIDQSPGGTDDMNIPNTSKTGYYLKKFLTDNVNLVQGSTVQNQWVDYRYAEVLLNYAEAMNEAYGPEIVPAGYVMSARDAVQMIRDRASVDLPAITGSSIAQFREVIKHERRIELAFEGHRYWDLLRWLDAEIVLNQPIEGVVVNKTAEGQYTYQVLNVASRKFLKRNYRLPFARSEIVNTDGVITQNEGY